MKRRNIFLAILLSACVADPDELVAAPPPAVESRQLHIATKQDAFGDWKQNFRLRAIDAGITPTLVDTALADIYVNERIIALDKKQPEHKLTKEEYLAKVINNVRVQKGKKLLAENRALLDDISKKSGVEPEFIVALWGLETGYGENTGNFSVVNSLATLAYEGRRREFFEKELVAALKIIQEGHITLDDMIGSWAGAMGQCQFMPSSFLSYAVDYDGDAKADIWHNRTDVFASIANYLYTVGWGQSDEAKEKALMNWNRSTYFVASVFKLAGLIKG